MIKAEGRSQDPGFTFIFIQSSGLLLKISTDTNASQ